MEEVRKKYRDQLVQAGWGSQLNSIVGPGSLDNPVVAHYGFGKETNDWKKLVRSTSFLYMWYVRLLVGMGFLSWVWLRT